MAGIKNEIVVLGAGVIGLQTALTLLENGYGVTIVAKHWPGDDDINYASMKAGAHWRTHAGPEDIMGQKFDAETYRYWKRLLESGIEDTGLMVLPSLYIWDAPTPETIDNGAAIWWSTIVSNYRVMSPAELPAGAHFGISYESFCINPYKYCDFLLGRLGDLGVKTITTEVDSLEEVFELPGIENDHVVGMVNCTGLAAKELAHDEKMFPTRGQIILVKGEVEMARLRRGDGWTCYVIRRPGEGTVLGGSYQEGDWNADLDEELSRRIQERCAALAPELLVDGKFDIISQEVGRRPSRRSGPRIEVEWIKYNGSEKFICHHYGHSGAGQVTTFSNEAIVKGLITSRYQNSYGSAKEAVRLINQSLER